MPNFRSDLQKNFFLKFLVKPFRMAAPKRLFSEAEILEEGTECFWVLATPPPPTERSITRMAKTKNTWLKNEMILLVLFIPFIFLGLLSNGTSVKRVIYLFYDFFEPTVPLDQSVFFPQSFNVRNLKSNDRTRMLFCSLWFIKIKMIKFNTNLIVWSPSLCRKLTWYVGSLPVERLPRNSWALWIGFTAHVNEGCLLLLQDQTLRVFKGKIPKTQYLPQFDRIFEHCNAKHERKSSSESNELHGDSQSVFGAIFQFRQLQSTMSYSFWLIQWSQWSQSMITINDHNY